MGLVVALAGTASAGLFGTDYNKIEYLCADWGPVMTLPTKINEVAQFNDAEDEVYFLKQVTSFTRKKLLTKDMWSGLDYQDIGKGLSIWLCKMKADGSGKVEIKELWKNPAYPIDTQTQSTWMSVNVKTRTIALSIIYAGSDSAGLWTVSLEGKGLKRIIELVPIDGRQQAINCPSWTPDGSGIVYEEGLRSTSPRRARIARCDRDGANRSYLTDGPEDRQPSSSPDGKRIAFIHWIIKGAIQDSWLWLMDVDGANQRPLLNPQAKPFWSAKAHWGTYPAWSPDGQRIYVLSAGVLDVRTGKVINNQRPRFEGKPWAAELVHWGSHGLLGSATGFRITLTDTNLTTVKALALSGLSKCSGKADTDRW